MPVISGSSFSGNGELQCVSVFLESAKRGWKLTCAWNRDGRNGGDCLDAPQREDVATRELDGLE